MKIIKDSDFIRGAAPMTKEEIRTLSLSKFCLASDDVILDIGGGSGAMAITIAKNIPDGKVITVERKSAAVELIEKNKDKFQVHNLEIIHGSAPNDLPKVLVDNVFIGGTGGKLEEMIVHVNKYLKPEGTMVLNFITIENIGEALKVLKKYPYSVEVTQATISKSHQIKNLTLMKTHNTVTIIKAEKEKA